MRTLILFAAILSLALVRFAVHGASAASTFVDDHGVMRWTATGSEVVQFGVNYTTPFAHAFRAHRRLGVPLETAIDADVYHLARLGMDAYRVHVWDREISDAAGNLVINDHVRAFDHLLARLKERGIKIVLTPLQFGNAGYPEPGEPLDGFSNKYGKRGCLEDRESWPLQERYLAQFVSHVNPLTGLAYKDDPDVVALEICNEPGHFEYDLTLEYINRMTKAIRDTGCAIPVFYNMSHGLPVFEAYLDADVQGGTFQWYPSNLVAGHEQWGNFLPYVDDYPIPFADHPKFKRKAKIVYEFDAADIGRSYIYPAIARTYRTTGMQIATQFAYDPMFIAPFNTEYQTHYLNLAYAPQKALGMMVAGEAFRRIPLFKSYGRHPHNTSFEGVRISYEDDLAELVTLERFLHSNTTTSRPPAPERLEQIAGFGCSPVVDYPGRGAYFLDRVESGVWRLEVMPDALWVRDPFEKPSPHKQVALIAWNEWPMRIDLPDLGHGFSVSGLNDGNTLATRADGTTIRIRPGAYLLTRAGVTSTVDRTTRLRRLELREFVAPRPSLERTVVLHEAAPEASAGRDLRINVTVASPDNIKSVELVAYLPRRRTADEAPERPNPRAQPGGGNTPGVGERNTGGAVVIAMKPIDGFDYVAGIPADRLHPGTLRYHVVVTTDGGVTTFPPASPAYPFDWHFFVEAWQTRIVPAEAPVLLFDAASDARKITADGRGGVYPLVTSDRPGTHAIEVVTRDLAEGEHDHSLRFFFKEETRHRSRDLAGRRKLVLYGRSASDRPCPVQLALVTSDGIAYGDMISLGPEFSASAVPIEALQQVRAPNIPHGYPVFIPYWSSVDAKTPLDLARAEAVMISIGPGIAPTDYERTHGVQIERIWLE